MPNPVKAGKFKRKAAVTLPAIKEVVGQSIYVQFMSDVKETADISLKGEPELDANGKPKVTHTADAVDMETGEMCTVVFRAAVLSEITRHCGGNKIKGRAFEIEKHDKKDGKRYYTYTIHEIEAEPAL